MNYAVELAKELRKRDNVEPFGGVLGVVISANPLRVSIYNNQVILTEKQCYVCNGLLTKSADIVLDNVAEHGSISTSCKITNIINDGDKLLCLPTSDGQHFFIIDKVGEVT